MTATKTAFVTAYLKRHPQAAAKDVVAEAAASGLKLHASTVHYVKNRMRLQSILNRPPEPGTEPQPPPPEPEVAAAAATAVVTAASRDMVEMVSLLQVLARHAGGRERLKQLIDLVVRD